MANVVKGAYLRILALYAHAYAVLIFSGWVAGQYGLIEFPLSFVTVVLAVLPSLYYIFAYNFISSRFGRKMGYTIGVIVLVTPMLVIFLTTSGYISVNNLALASLVFLSATLGPALPIALVWMLTVGYILALSGYIPSVGDVSLGALLLLLYGVSGLLGWAFFRRYYVREGAEAEALRKTLRTQQLQSESVIAAIDEGVVIIDGPSGRVVHANQQFLDMLALKHDEFIGKHYSDVVNERVRIVGSTTATPRIGKNVEHVFKTGEPITIDTLSAEYLDGNSVDISVAISPLKNDDGDISAIMIRARDISSIMRLQRMKDALIATASHELRTPITVIAGYADLLLGNADAGKLTEKQRHYLERTKETTAHLTEMVNDMLEMSRLESGESNDSPTAANAQQLLESVTESNLSQFASKGLTLHLEASRIRVFADPARFKQVVNHLLSNAFKFTPEGGKVTIANKVVGDMCEVTVTDTGPGVPDAHLSDIFEKFSKLDDTGSIPGAGIGLAITKNIVDNWGGTIVAENTHQGGAQFRFTVPLAKEEPSKEGKDDTHENSDN